MASAPRGAARARSTAAARARAVDAAPPVAATGGGPGRRPHRLPLTVDQLYVNEVNTIPGSLARYLWVDPPLAFRTLLVDLVDEAQSAPTHAYSAAGADGTVLRGAASIAAKLA